MLARVCVVAVSLVFFPSLDAYGQDGRLARLNAPTRTLVAAVIDSARTAGLPTEPLLDKALEGASKGADGARIVAAVRSLAIHLRLALAALGAEAAEPELLAAAGALRAGADSSLLVRLRSYRTAQPLTIPLAVLSDLVARGVPTETAARAVVSLATTGATDDAYLILRRAIERDVEAGVPPVVAASIRTRGLPTSLPPVPARGTPTDAANKPRNP